MLFTTNSNSFYTNSIIQHFSLHFGYTFEVTKTNKMKLQGSYYSVIKMYLTKYNQVKIHFDTHGKVVKTEKEKNGLWQTDRNLCKLLNKLPVTS